MIPIALDPTQLRLAVAGRGVLAHNRLAALREGGADPVFFSDETGIENRAMPDGAALDAVDVLWIVGLPDDEAFALAEIARAHRVLVNVEDRRAQCGFHNVAQVRRGDLLLTVSTNGQSPGLAGRIRARLAAEYGPEWGDRLAELGARRLGWKRDGEPIAELARRTDATLDQAGWLR